MTTPPPQYAPPPPLNPADEKTWSILVHIGGILFSWVAPLIVYLVLKDRGAFVRHNSSQALNFQLTLLIAYVAGVILSFVLIGVFVIIAVSIVSIVFGIIAAIAASNGQEYRYPLTIQFTK